MKIEYTPGFLKDMRREFGWQYAPYRFFRWLRYLPKHIQWFFQRGIRGYADCDLWNLNSYLAGWLPKALRQLDKIGMGHPPTMTEKEWSEELEKMAVGFEAVNDIMDLESEAPDADKIVFERSMKSFTKHFINLWD